MEKTLRYKVLLASKSGNKPRRLCFEEMGGDQGRWMEIMAGKFDASSSLTIILVAIYYFRVLSFWSLKNNKEGGHFIPSSEKNL